MTISTTVNKVIHAGDGVQLIFAYNFIVLDESHMQVYVDETLQTLTTDYTISGIGNPSGGDVTFLTAPANDTQVTLLRSVPLTQLVAYAEYDPFPAATHESALDLHTMADQQQQEELDRAIKAPLVVETGVDYTWPSYDAGKAIMWSEADPKVLTVSDDMVNDIISDASAQAVAAAASAAAAVISAAAAAASAVDAAADVINCQDEVVLATAQTTLATAWAEAAAGSDPPGATHGSAKAWAETAEDSLVDGTGYSAKHWAAKAMAAAASGLYSSSEHTATAGQTVFTHSAAVTSEQISINGAIIGSADYSVTDTDEITLTAGANAGDIVRIQTIGLIQVNSYVPIGGNPAEPMTGALVLSGDPTLDLHAAPKQYVDALSAAESNLIINPDFDISQRGTSIQSVTGVTYGPDRWAVYDAISSGSVFLEFDGVIKPTVEESGHYANRSLYIRQFLSGSMGATAHLGVRYVVEGYDIKPHYGGAITLSFWVRSGLAGTYCISFQNGAKTRSYVVEYTIDAIDTWEKKIITIDLDEATGVWEETNAAGLIINWTLDAGTNFETTANAWQTGDYTCTSNQAAWFPTPGEDFYLSQVKLEGGSVATPFVSRTIAEEVSLCQRYFQVVATDGNTLHQFGNNFSAGDNYYASVLFSTTMRAWATVTITDVVEIGTAFNGISAGSITPAIVTSDGFRWLVTCTTTNGSPSSVGIAYKADAEL